MVFFLGLTALPMTERNGRSCPAACIPQAFLSGVVLLLSDHKITVFTEFVLCARHCFNCFIYMDSFNP